MDKKNFAFGALFLIGAIFAFTLMPRPTPPAALPAVPATTGTTADGTTPAATPAGQPLQSQPLAPSTFAAVRADDATATITTLANDFIVARFTDSGGALRDVAFKKYPATLGQPEPFVFNAVQADPMLALVDFPGLDRNARYERVSVSETEIVYRAVLDGRIEVIRRYVVSPSEVGATDPYQIRHETTFRNLTDQTVPAQYISLSLGTAAPTNDKDTGLHLATGYATIEDEEFVKRDDLSASGGFIGIGARDAKATISSSGDLTWVAVKNQFFSSILTPDDPAVTKTLVTRRVKLFPSLTDDNHNAFGVTGTAQINLAALAPNGEAKLGANLYVGPNEYRRLANSDVFKANQDKVMQFGFFKWFSQILLTIMTWIHGSVGNWGWAIVLTTLFLKIIFVPFTLAASRSAKRMAKLQPEMQAIREKHKDNPRKQQEATMALFKTHKVNPVGGCFPILITIPFFMGFFQMLQSTAELRFAPFLWAVDLSQPDTIAHVFGIPINIMPILMGATMVIQMKLTPTPSVDNAQMKIMQFMPYIFTLFCYGFSCALSLYSFTNGLFTIVQQLIINKMKDPADALPASAGASAATTVAALKKPVKNVTPKKGEKR